MQTNLVLTSLPLNDFLKTVREIIREEMKANAAPPLPEKLLSPAEVCQELNVSIPTINSWVSKGLIQKHRISGRVFYKMSEIVASLETLKKFKR
jgi:hypothetical protein